jgi:hypothetical protein
MPSDGGFDLAAFKAHLDVVYHDRPTDVEPVGLDLFGPPSRPLSWTGNRDVLVEATAAQRSPAATTVTPAPPDAGKATDQSPQPDSDSLAEAARNKLAQEAMLASPAEMRKLFPTVLKDVSLNHNDHLDLAEIENGLKNKQLSQTELNFLTVLKNGYQVLSQAPGGDIDKSGVSATSLAMIDKAMNRSIKDDPIYSHTVLEDLGKGIGLGVAAGGYAAWNLPGPLWKVLGLVGGAVIGVATQEALGYVSKEMGSEDVPYDNVEAKYKSFVQSYENK